MAANLEIFFKIAFTREPGYVCIATIAPDMEGVPTERFFLWPEKLPEMLQYIAEVGSSANVYFCPQLLDYPKRRKVAVRYCTNVWADLDSCAPDKLLVRPTILIESSPNRYQALWSLAEPVPPADGEALSRRVAYAHAHQGADRSGWDLGQLIRVPGSFNHKYSPPVEVNILDVTRSRFRSTDFIEYPEVHNTELLTLPLPTPEVLPTLDPLELMQKYRRALNPQSFILFDQEPHGSWSEVLWKLMLLLFEAGMEREEVFYVTLSAKCNKYERDKKPPEFLWRDVCRAYLRHEENVNVIVTQSEQPDLLSSEEIAWAKSQETFVERYTKWASGLGDAATQYHPAGAFIILSSLLGGRVRLPTSFGVVGLNLWFMILADTTLTRKSTAMDLAIDLLALVDEDAILATDGSIEGLMTGLQHRSGRPSVFLRDEFSGLIEAMTKKDYMAGMMETLTKLYDGKMQKRLLKKEAVTITKPVLIIFAGGIKAKVQQLLSLEEISSGFIPRFLFVTAESSTARMQPMGPPTVRDYSGRDSLVEEMQELYSHYVQAAGVQNRGTFQVPTFREWDAELTPAAWARYNKFEQDMMQAGMDSGRPELMTPMYDRMSKSTLKAAVLLSASRQREETVVVEESDIVLAIWYCRDWRNYGNDVVNGVGKNAAERSLERTLHAITRNPGITRGKLMQTYHLTAREADAIFTTLEQRGQVTVSKQGRGWSYYPVLGI